MKIKKTVHHFPLFFILIFLFQSKISAQTLGFTLDCGDAEIDGVYCAPMRVFGFSEMISIQMSFNWDETVLNFKELQNENLDHIDGSYSSINASELVLSWADLGYVGINREDSTVIFDICFDVVGNLGDTSNIIIQAPSNSGVMEISNLDGIIANDVINFDYENCPSTVVMSVATNNLEASLFQMYPNPATKYISFETSRSFTSIAICDSSGKKILSQDFEEHLDVSKLKAGWYLVKLMNDNETAVQKLFVINED